MIHTVHLDDTTINGRKLLRELHRYKKGIKFENPVTNDVAPEGYMTLEEFRVAAKLSLTKILNEHGVYQ